MSRPGYRNGFNPFRRGGKFATATSADVSSDAGAGAAAAALGVTNSAIGAKQVNDTIRAAAGRGGSSSSSSSSSGGGGGSSAPTQAEYHAMPMPETSKISPATRKALNAAFSMIDPGAYEEDPKHDMVDASTKFYGDDINAVSVSMLTGLMQRGPSNPKDPHSIARNKEIANALISAYGDAGIHPAKDLTPQKMLAIYDSVPTSWSKGGAPDQAQAHAIASALSMGNMELAYTIADGQGAGIGWGLTRQDFRKEHGLPDDGRD